MVEVGSGEKLSVNCEVCQKKVIFYGKRSAVMCGHCGKCTVNMSAAILPTCMYMYIHRYLYSRENTNCLVLRIHTPLLASHLASVLAVCTYTRYIFLFITRLWGHLLQERSTFAAAVKLFLPTTRVVVL